MQISTSKLRSQLLAVLREIELEDTEVIVTDSGRPVAKIIKYHVSPTTESYLAIYVDGSSILKT